MISVGIIDKNFSFYQNILHYLNRFNNVKLELYCANIQDLENSKYSNIDVLLTDHNSIAIEQIKLGKFRKCEIIVLSDYIVPKDIINAIKSGVSAYLLKTDNLYEIYQAITTVYTGGRVLDSHVTKIIMDTLKRKEADVKWPTLTSREKDFAECLLKGLSYKQIAEELFVTESTVNFHLQNIYFKLNVKSKSEFMAKYLNKFP